MLFLKYMLCLDIFSILTVVSISGTLAYLLYDGKDDQDFTVPHNSMK